MTSFKDHWDLEMALQVMQHQTVDSKTWADAVKWLLLYGPPAIKEMISQASSMATENFFPELTPIGYNDEGEPLYDIQALAKSLGISEEEAMEKIAELEKKYGIKNIFGEGQAHKIH
ncbi:MAG: hypothetical protein OEY01_09090 [Desulfobulbaceae bacterium]|nr:hypothetical protein [Desulfobulbaceae bacterium]HIJ79157.1 hypothetical protein [Deltaproteobacteria bacterium]